MEALITIVHYGICVFLIGVILLQAGKGADIGAAFGAGGSQTVFGARGPATFLNKLTVGAAITFLITSIALAQMAKTTALSSVVDAAPAQTAPAAPAEPETAPVGDTGKTEAPAVVPAPETPKNK